MDVIKGLLVDSDMNSNKKLLESFFADCPDIIIKDFNLKDDSKILYVYADGLVDTELLFKTMYDNLLQLKHIDFKDNPNPVYNTKKFNDMETVISDVLSGNVVFFPEGLNWAYSLPITHTEKRNIMEPEVEKNLKGAHDGFIESLAVNMALLRQKIKNTSLKFKTCQVGSVTHQKLSIAYMEGIADTQLLNELYSRVSNVNFDAFIGIGYVQQQISDFKYSIFPQMLTTERPDKAVASLMEGRFVILLDGTPVALIAPVNIFSFFQAPDDYNTSWILGSFTRTVRYLAAFLAVMLPPSYIALTSFHYFMIPLSLLVPFAESRSRVPFTPVVEALIMEIVIEFIRESAIRLPSYIGITIGVTGGIILGQATVQAGIVSNIFLIVIGITALASYVTPSHDMVIAIRFLRIPFMLFSSLFGIIGIVFCSTMTFARLLTLESLGQPYLQPLTPFKFNDLKDAVIRAPFTFLTKLPDNAKPIKKFRGESNE